MGKQIAGDCANGIRRSRASWQRDEVLEDEVQVDEVARLGAVGYGVELSGHNVAPRGDARVSVGRLRRVEEKRRLGDDLDAHRSLALHGESLKKALRGPQRGQDDPVVAEWSRKSLADRPAVGRRRDHEDEILRFAMTQVERRQRRSSVEADGEGWVVLIHE